MSNFNKRQAVAIRRFYIGAIVVFIFGFITFNATRAALDMYGKFTEAAAAADQAQQNLAELTAQDASVKAEVAALNSPQGQEAQLRQSYGVALPGEGEIQIIQQSTTSDTATPAPQGNFFVNILRALFMW